MTQLAVLQALPASVASAIVKTERVLRRESLKSVVDRNPGGKLAAKARLLISDLDQLDDWIAEAGGEDGLVMFICARVAGGETLADWCAAYALDMGLVWAFLSEDEERLERYYRAQRGVADRFVAEVVPLVDQVAEGGEGGGRGGGGGSSSPDVPHRRLQAEMRLKVAAKYDRRRFGEEKETGSVSAPTINFIMGDGAVVSVQGPAIPAEPAVAVLTGETV